MVVKFFPSQKRREEGTTEREREREKELPKALHSKRDYLELSKKYFLHARKAHFYISELSF